MEPPYFPELITCLRDTLRQIERDEMEENSPEIQELKRRIVLLLADLELKRVEEWKAA